MLYSFLNLCFQGVTPTEALEQFTDGERLPLEDLPLTRAHLSDRLLANLVAAHQTRLKSLDISETQVHYFSYIF